MNTQLEDIYEQQADRHIANLIGITVEDYQSLEHSGIQEVTSSDDMVYGHYIQFSNNSPKEILTKIKNIDSTNTVYLNASLFEIGS